MSTEVPSALVDSVRSGPNGAEVEEIGLHRYHVVGRAKDWGAAQEESRRHCSAIRIKENRHTGTGTATRVRYIH